MLPILPALLLLILNGPSGLDRMAHDGSLPEALRALNDRIKVEGSSAGSLKGQQEAVLASLLAVQGDPDLSQVLAELMYLAGLDNPADVQPTSPIVATLCREPVPCGPPVGSLNNGFERSVRSRDGPPSR